MTNLIPDGTRSPKRCVVKGCANVPAKDTAICAVHAQALRGPAPANRELGPAELAALKRRMACPDCISVVHVDQVAGAIGVEHDPTCPTLAARVRDERDVEVTIVPDDPPAPERQG